jgi:hypothetical protein
VCASVCDRERFGEQVRERERGREREREREREGGRERDKDRDSERGKWGGGGVGERQRETDTETERERENRVGRITNRANRELRLLRKVQIPPSCAESQGRGGGVESVHETRQNMERLQGQQCCGN